MTAVQIGWLLVAWTLAGFGGSLAFGMMVYRDDDERGPAEGVSAR